MMPPSRAIVREWLRDLAHGEVSRESAANAARPWIGEREREVTDPSLWVPLTRLASADIESDPSEYLYDLWDFEAWLAEFEMATGPDEPS